MTEKEFQLKKCFENTIWMAIRYANGRHTYAPYIVRDVVNTYKKLYPEWNLTIDDVVIKDYQRFKDHPENNLDLPGFPKEDWLIDLYQPSFEEREEVLKDMMRLDEDNELYDPQ